MAPFAPGMKTIDDALDLRGRILGAFEMAETERRPRSARRLLTFAGRRRRTDGRRDGGSDRRAGAPDAPTGFPLDRRRAGTGAPVRRRPRSLGQLRRPALVESHGRAQAAGRRRAHPERGDEHRRDGDHGQAEGWGRGRGGLSYEGVGGRRARIAPGGHAGRGLRSHPATAPDGSRSCPTPRCPGTRRCSRSGT